MWYLTTDTLERLWEYVFFFLIWLYQCIIGQQNKSMTMNQTLYSNDKNPEIIIIGRQHTSTVEVDNRTQSDNPFNGMHLLFVIYLCIALIILVAVTVLFARRKKISSNQTEQLYWAFITWAFIKGKKKLATCSVNISFMLVLITLHTLINYDYGKLMLSYTIF